ncbi:hypothetical protein TraAM80_00297 [Trypanosoma rangeli]|uniref:Uncharacterized protein n=1 Tax=Trypanosoma rangeli TaxID=5698 RepID=A0A422P438_TRYRA|nr:uncharacterized protein TraAM80_00297 [Trypanosoma rangeli]RNF12445.1 hypothetical protein TraAM80_00297 [Trypanosoma rangeli]|eukprot:RNF12445.1 hypothetical protein TraAM80_00297 [Trypanosoma rangeli]
MHLPSTFLPVMFHRLCRQRDLAAFRMSSFVLHMVLQALEHAPPDSLSCEDVTCIQVFIQKERRKAVLHCGRTVAPKPNGEKSKTIDLEDNRLLADIETRVMLRCCHSNVDGAQCLRLVLELAVVAAVLVVIVVRLPTEEGMGGMLPLRTLTQSRALVHPS